MELLFIVYGIGCLEPLDRFLATAPLILAAGSILLTLFQADASTSSTLPKGAVERRAKVCGCVLFCMWTLNSLLPSEDTAYKILAAYGVQSVAESDAVAALAPKSLEFLELTLDKQLEGLRGEQQ